MKLRSLVFVFLSSLSFSALANNIVVFTTPIENDHIFLMFSPLGKRENAIATEIELVDVSHQNGFFKGGIVGTKNLVSIEYKTEGDIRVFRISKDTRFTVALSYYGFRSTLEAYRVKIKERSGCAKVQFSYDSSEVKIPEPASKSPDHLTLPMPYTFTDSSSGYDSDISNPDDVWVGDDEQKSTHHDECCIS